MTSEQMSSLPSLISYINSDLFTLENISSKIILSRDAENTNAELYDVMLDKGTTVYKNPLNNLDTLGQLDSFKSYTVTTIRIINGVKYGKLEGKDSGWVELPTMKWYSVIDYLPLRFYRVLESYPDMYTIESFDQRYRRNPKLCAYEKYDLTNMWRPLMILNRCPSIMQFDFQYIRYYNITVFSEVLSVLISRIKPNVQL